jgi:serine/threonine-protein kinase
MCGRYQLIERIGSGGMAEVYKARLPGPSGFRKTVVIKRILPRLLDEPVVVQMFIEEAKIAAAADHDNVAHVFELGQADDGKHFIVMEFISGVDLEVLLRGAAQRSLRVPIWFGLQVVIDVLEALSYVHSLVDDEGRPRNVIHRDATPSNIFLSHRGGVKLTDFGVAAFAGKAPTTIAGQLKGKIVYMSPEQLNGRPLDQRSDIFSIGVVLWELLTQQRLFGSLSDVQAMVAICDAERQRPSAIRPDVPPSLDEVVLRALAADRENRFQTAVDFQAAVLGCLYELRHGVRPAEMKRVVEILTGRAEPDDETTAQPLAGGKVRSTGSFLSKLDMPKPVRESNLEFSILNPPLDRDTRSERMLGLDDFEGTTLATDDSDSSDVEDLRWEVEERRRRRIGSVVEGTNAFWLRSPDRDSTGPHPYDEARVLIAEAANARTPISISVDQRHWMSLGDLCARSAQDFGPECAGPSSRVLVAGSLAQRSIAAVFGLIARDRETGTLSVANRETGAWYEIDVIVGQPSRVATNVAIMQLPEILEARGVSPDQVEKILYGVVKTGRPWDEVARSEGLIVEREDLESARLGELFRWTRGDYWFNLHDVAPHPPFAGSLLALLPRAVIAALPPEDLETRLGRRLAKGFEPSWRFADALEELSLDPEESAIVDRLKSATPIAQVVAERPGDRRVLAFAYALAEADLLLEALET